MYILRRTGIDGKDITLDARLRHDDLTGDAAALGIQLHLTFLISIVTSGNQLYLFVRLDDLEPVDLFTRRNLVNRRIGRYVDCLFAACLGQIDGGRDNVERHVGRTLLHLYFSRGSVGVHEHVTGTLHPHLVFSHLHFQEIAVLHQRNPVALLGRRSDPAALVRCHADVPFTDSLVKRNIVLRENQRRQFKLVFLCTGEQAKKDSTKEKGVKSLS